MKVTKTDLLILAVIVVAIAWIWFIAQFVVKLP